MQTKTILVTGGLGFIGKHFIERMLSKEHNIINIDGYTYAADRKASIQFKTHPNYIESREYLHNLGYLPICDYVINFAAESHVDNSITNSSKFIDTNISGTHKLLELIKNTHISHRPHFIQISTDEVYGDSKNGEIFTENSILTPSSPYSASKAAADQLTIAYSRTYNIKYNIIRMTNCFGHNQYPEKLIPTVCLNLKNNKPVPIHGSGNYIRTWLFVEDAVKAIGCVMDLGNTNTIYNVAGNYRYSNLEIVKTFFEASDIKDVIDNYIVYVPNRLGQDLDYHIDDTKIRNLGWRPTKGPRDLAKSIYRNFDKRRFISR